MKTLTVRRINWSTIPTSPISPTLAVRRRPSTVTMTVEQVVADLSKTDTSTISFNYFAAIITGTIFFFNSHKLLIFASNANKESSAVL